ncbi:MAG: LON peptidase substrate-binding domain-containing protein, partial [Bacteroidota bacterium]
MRVLPLFPLQLVVFPNEKVNLHIFEPRYKKLIRHCEENSENFGIIPYIKGK